MYFLFPIKINHYQENYMIQFMEIIMDFQHKFVKMQSLLIFEWHLIEKHIHHESLATA